MMKRCSKCGVEKELNRDNFHACKKDKLGFKSDCKECRNKYNRERRKNKGPEFGVWESMKRRCHSKTHPAYTYYGERGVRVCAEWRESFDSFIRDMGRRPGKNYTLERIDNDGYYTKDNCKWVTWQEQSRNKRAGERKISPETGVPGVWWREDKNKWTAYISANNKRYYLGYYDELEDAIKARKQAELKYWN